MSVSVSETIGKLLLEGYKMLADSCDICNTVLMQDRRGRAICVQCESLSMANAGRPDTNGEVSTTTTKMSNGGNTRLQQDNAANANNTTISEESRSLTACQEVLETEIKKATQTLQRLSQQDHDLQGKLVYIKYIRECAETIVSLKAVKKA